jgi:large subunit ribosomal protein L1
MAKDGKNTVAANKKVDRSKMHTIQDAVMAVKAASFAKFDESVDLAVRLGVDPRHADQNIRGAVILPHGTGKDVRVICFARGEKAKEAEAAGALEVGAEELVKKIQDGWFDFDKAVATPDMMAVVGRIGRVLGPRGVMPNPKVGTVTMDVTKAITDLKGGKVEYRVEKAGIVHAPIGRVSFTGDQLADNAKALLGALAKARPASAKGAYMKRVTVSSTHGPSLNIDAAEAAAAE